MKPVLTTFTLLLALCLLAQPAVAATERFLLTESDPGGLNNVFLRGFDDLAGLKSLSQSSVSDISTNSTPTSSINGLTWAGDRFLMLVEADPGLSGIFLREFSTLNDVKSANPSNVTFLGSSIGGSGVSIGGLSWNGDKIFMATESDPGGLGNVFLREFNSLGDLRSLNQTGVTHIGTNIGGTGVSVTGLDYDGDDWYMTTESDPGGLGNVFLRTFDTLADLKSLNQQSAPLIGTNIGGTGVSTHALMSFSEPIVPLTPVPLPPSLPLLAFGLFGLGLLRRIV
jgi:hypothetical protein